MANRPYAVKVDNRWVENKAGLIKKFSTSEKAGEYGFKIAGDWDSVAVIYMPSED